MITGRRGSGKDVTAVALALELQKSTGKPVYSNYDPEKFKRLPKTWKHRKGDTYEPESIQLISDAHLEYFSRDWQQQISKALIKLVSVSRHRNIDFIYTTQLSTLLDRQAIANLDVLIFKEPSTLAADFERPELQSLTEQAKDYFHDGKTQNEKWKTAIAFTHTGTHEIRDIEKPKWFTEEMSKLYGQKDPEQQWEQIL